MNNSTTNQVGNNKEGVGGFGDHPEHRSDGRWSKNNSFTYWMNFFKNMSTDEFLLWEKNTPSKDRSVAADLAYARISKSRSNLREFQEVANRTEGMPKQSMKIEGEIKTILVEFINGPDEIENSSSE